MSRPVSLSDVEADFIDALIRSGAYSSAEEVIAAGLRALRSQDEEERWLQNDVAPVFDAMKADPSRGIPAADVFAELRARHAARVARS